MLVSKLLTSRLVKLIQPLNIAYIFVTFDVKDGKGVLNGDEKFVIWTTTPWTLPSNVALTVNPEIDYLKVKKDDEIYYVSKPLANKVLGEGTYEVLETMKGKDLEYVEYE